jgi:CheY-like chemotaxis protein
MPSSANVLLIEDDFSLRAALVDALIHEGHSVHVARNGAEGLGLLAHVGRPVLIFLDLNMPIMDGVTFLSHLSEWRDRDRFEVVIMTAAVSIEWFRATRRVINAMRKPFDVAEVVDVTRDFALRHSPPRRSRAGVADRPGAFVSAASAPPSEPEE